MTTTSLYPHKPPLKTRNPLFLRSTYYGSVGRPSSGEWRRKSAVELLQESKAFYVKSESVLDTKQELKNADHLHVRSPTLDVSGMRGEKGGGGFPFHVVCPCPPYPHSHFEHHGYGSQPNDYYNIQPITNPPPLNNKEASKSGKQKRGTGGHSRRSVPPPASLPLHLHMNMIQMESKDGGRFFGLPLPFPLGQISSSLPRNMEKHMGSQPVVITSWGGSSANPPPVPNQGNGGRDEESPPPLPPKSPRTTSKPVRPHDFPQRLIPNNSEEISHPKIPPSPPRRTVSRGESCNNGEMGQNGHPKLRRLFKMEKSNGTGKPGLDPTLPITLPSPILPPTPPPDVVMESPMSDSGPIISPPPAFSTPVTPMLDRQNSSASEKAGLRHSASLPPQPLNFPGITNSSFGPFPPPRKNMKSIPDLSHDISKYSPPMSLSISTSSPSPVSVDDSRRAAGGDGEADRDGDEEDDESSGMDGGFKGRNKVLKKIPLIPKSITENVLCKASGLYEEKEPSSASNHQQNHRPLLHANEVSPVRRPILRSKSDLSHRYLKARSSANLTSGFTLVHVDLGLIGPPLPAHQNGRKEGDERRVSRSSSELEKFFDHLGLENPNESIPPPLPLSAVPSKEAVHRSAPRSTDSSPVFFSSVSSIDSLPRKGGSVDSGDSPVGLKIGSRTVGGGGYNSSQSSVIVVQHGEPSIVERNARVIKWLFNCKKAVENR